MRPSASSCPEPYSPDSDARLLEHLAPIAEEARRIVYSVAVRCYRDTDEGVDLDEYHQFSTTAAFLAFVDCGGSSENPDAFDWAARQRCVVVRTVRHLQYLLRRGDRNSDDLRLREKRRSQVGGVVDELRWDTWDAAAVAMSRQHHQQRRQDTGVGDIGTSMGREYLRNEPADTEDEALLQVLGAKLAELLSPGDLDLLIRHHAEGVSQRELAKEQGVTENTMNVKMHRARERAKKRLPKEWHDLVKRLK